ncbi:gamma-glutamyl-gamma-aminobutyrate hydrolase family protein [Spongisporangium articulatum]|uniref:Gamma-glutamyl-gamma-aminobutyrate hydrolase family protein n=1 Tax=Spongisporangium articulatum TaxID=3362603 RepID=A0ABW8AQK3_9ACTN
MAAPLIGITTYREPAHWGVWHGVTTDLLPAAYADSVRAAGGLPVLLPSVPGVEAALARLDGLVLAGGADVDPARYGADAHERTGAPRAQRDDAELALLAAAEAADVPVLAVCRGVQVLNVARGGTLTQHVPELVGHEDHNPAPGVYGHPEVHVHSGTRLEALLGASAAGGLKVACHHHQAVERLGRGLVVVARSSDGVVEAVEDPGRDFLLGVQWHPEEGEDGGIFAGLVEAASRRPV